MPKELTSLFAHNVVSFAHEPVMPQLPGSVNRRYSQRYVEKQYIGKNSRYEDTCGMLLTFLHSQRASNLLQINARFNENVDIQFLFG